MNSSDSSSSVQLLPPGFRFHPSDQELIIHYLRNRVTSSPLPASVIAEVDLYQFDPWELPKKALFGEDEWYFFTPRERKYPNGARPNRAAASGYWKATGIDKPIFASSGAKNIGVKKALVFYSGRPPRGVKTDWIMHEYRLLDTTTTWKQKGSMRLDDWVLCRVWKKSSIIRNKWEDLSPSHLPEDGYFQREKGLWSLNKDPTARLFKDYANNCPLVPYLLDTPTFPCVETDSSTGSRKIVHVSTTTTLTRNPTDKEKMEFSRSSLENLFDLFKECSSEPNNISGTEAGSTICLHQGRSKSCTGSNEINIDSSDTERFLPCKNLNYMRKDDNFMNLHATDNGVNFTGTEQTQFFQNFGAEEWNAIFQI
ncbi:NAC domain-containing protein 67-like [Punica granatum]|uniref:Uncharacterized protein n=2 Tax=Punica granatum TaxID=22663 RepID=A0A2I0KI37_PUNGR|nr:NAC domain-containing protein 67-like [Punica granatum]PKI68158.1 hypothetical protein CRG98_011457 [Punica granatum]